MIRIYRECVDARSCMAEWELTTATNLRNAILAAAHAPFLKVPIGPLVIEIDGELYGPDQLPRPGKKILDRCSFWLYAVGHARNEAVRDRPGFGL